LIPDGFIGNLLGLVLSISAFPVTILCVHAYSAQVAYQRLQRSLRRRSYAY
jgi:hypothetical protein